MNVHLLSLSMNNNVVVLFKPLSGQWCAVTLKYISSINTEMFAEINDDTEGWISKHCGNHLSFIGFLAFEWGDFWLYRLNFGNECFATDHVLFTLLCKCLEPPVVYFWKFLEFFFGHSLLFHSDFVYYLLQSNFYLFGKLRNIDLGIIQAHWILSIWKNGQLEDKI